MRIKSIIIAFFLVCCSFAARAQDDLHLYESALEALISHNLCLSSLVVGLKVLEILNLEGLI